MANTIVRVTEGGDTVVIYGADLLKPLVAAAEAARDTTLAYRNTAAGHSTSAANSAAQSAASAAASLIHSQNAGAYAAAVQDAVDGLPVDATLPLQAVSIAALQAFTGMTAGRQAILGQADREGLFIWSAANNSANVTADPYQGIYIAPASATSGASGAWVRVFDPDQVSAEWFGAVGNGSTADELRINAALAHPRVSTVRLRDRTYAVNSTVFIQSGKSLVGVSRQKTLIRALSSFSRHVGLPAVVGDPFAGATNILISDLAIDVNKVGLGLGASERIQGLLFSKTNGFVAERIDVKNATAYSFITQGSFPNYAKNGVIRDCSSQNANVHFESMCSDNVLWDNCRSSDGDGDIPCEAHLHALVRSRNITFRNCHGVGNGIGVSFLCIGGDQDNLRVEGCHLVSLNQSGIFVNGAIGELHTNLRLVDNYFESKNQSAARFTRTPFMLATNNSFISQAVSGSLVGVNLQGDCDGTRFSNSRIKANASGAGTNAFGISATAPGVVYDGIIEATYTAPAVGAFAISGDVTLSATTRQIVGPA